MSRYIDHGQGTRLERAAQHEARARELHSMPGDHSKAAEKHERSAAKLRKMAHLAPSMCDPSNDPSAFMQHTPKDAVS